MKAVRETVVQMLILLVAGIGVAFVANAVRGDGSLKWRRNYFDKGLARRIAGSARESSDGSKVHDSGSLASEAAATQKDRVPCSYQTVTFAEVVEILDDPKRTEGLYVFVDARKDDAFEAGHIPGAIQADHYQLDDYIDNLKERVVAADKIIVYCNGGDCEDSKFMCGDLLELGVELKALFLYTGGWKEWEQKNMPVETGR